METVSYRSKVDMWLAAVLIAAAVASCVAVALVAASGSPIAAVAMAPLLLLGAGLPVWVLLSTGYRLGPSSLDIRSGPFRWSVPLREIRAITPTRNPLSSPALSLDRLRIDYGRCGSIMVSPADPASFITELRERVPGL